MFQLRIRSVFAEGEVSGDVVEVCGVGESEEGGSWEMRRRLRGGGLREGERYWDMWSSIYKLKIDVWNLSSISQSRRNNRRLR